MLHHRLSNSYILQFYSSSSSLPLPSLNNVIVTSYLNDIVGATPLCKTYSTVLPSILHPSPSGNNNRCQNKLHKFRACRAVVIVN